MSAPTSTKSWVLDCLSVNARHTRFRWVDPHGASCGDLCLLTEDVASFLAAWRGRVRWNGLGVRWNRGGQECPGCGQFVTPDDRGHGMHLPGCARAGDNFDGVGQGNPPFEAPPARPVAGGAS